MRPINRKAVYAGTFDPPTNGHVWMLQQAAAMFDQVVVAIGVNPDKKALFSESERLAMLAEIGTGWDNVTVDSFEHKYLINYARDIGAKYIIRGIRDSNDYQYEKTMRHINADLNAEISTVFLMPPREIAEVSSSTVKGLVGPENWERLIQRYVPSHVFIKLLRNKHTLWRNCLQHGATGDEEAFWQRVMSPYLAPERVYHSIFHICSLLSDFYRIQHLLQDPFMVELAIWTHDIVYAPLAGNNEEKSAEFARQLMQEYNFFEPQRAQILSDAILLSKHSSVTPTPHQDIDYFLDMDLSILGKPADEFDAYESGVRAEYAQVPEEIFTNERTKILRSILARPTIYRTAYFQHKYEAYARDNLHRSIVRLEASSK